MVAEPCEDASKSRRTTVRSSTKTTQTSVNTSCCSTRHFVHLAVPVLVLYAALQVVTRTWADDSNSLPALNPGTSTPSFSLAIIPDSQNIMEEGNSNLWQQTIEWIETNRLSDFTVALGVGDCVNDCANTNQWLTYLHALRCFTNTPFVLAVGNHDGVSTNRDYARFNHFISSNFHAAKPWWRAAGHGFLKNGRQQNMFITLTNGTWKLLFGTLEFGPTTNQVLWFSNVCAAHPDHLCFLTTHSYLNKDGTLSVDGQIDEAPGISYSPAGLGWRNSCDGRSMFALLRGLPNLRLIVCGHQTCAPNEAFRTDTSDCGNPIQSQFVNYQCDRYAEGPLAGKYVSRVKIITFGTNGTGLARTFDVGTMTWTNAIFDHRVNLTGSPQ